MRKGGNATLLGRIVRRGLRQSKTEFHSSDCPFSQPGLSSMHPQLLASIVKEIATAGGEIMHHLTSETSLLVKAAGIVIGQCLFGLYGPFLFMRPLSWFEMNFPGAEAIGVVVGAAVGYGVAAGALRMYTAARTHPTSTRAASRLAHT